MPPRGFPAGSALYAEIVCPSFVFRSIICPIGVSLIKSASYGLYHIVIWTIKTDRSGRRPRAGGPTAFLEVQRGNGVCTGGPGYRAAGSESATGRLLHGIRNVADETDPAILGRFRIRPRHCGKQCS